jgi:tRNA pseudouridine65 synthase
MTMTLSKNAITHFQRLQNTEIALEFNNKPTSRYCLVNPRNWAYASITETFQTYISSHFRSRLHGCNKQNKLWLENYDLKE